MKPSTSEITQMIRCPVTKSELKAADSATIDQVNGLITNGELVNQIGQKINAAIEAGFVNQNETLLLPQRGGIVILISDQAIPMDQLDS